MSDKYEQIRVKCFEVVGMNCKQQSKRVGRERPNAIRNINTYFKSIPRFNAGDFSPFETLGTWSRCTWSQTKR